jgi:hypothetical protein
VDFRICAVKDQPEEADQITPTVPSMDNRPSGLGLKSWRVTPDE